MKILQKRTSRFVASLFNGLGIIACVSVSSCGSKGKNSKENETDELKKKLKETNDNFVQLDFDDQNKIAEWFKNNASQTNFTLSKDILKQIFTNDDKFKSVAQKLGFDISDPDDEENKLDSDDLKKKVAQKILEQKIDITDTNAVKKAVHDVVSEFQNEEETKMVTVKIEKDGKASIVYSDKHSNSFVFNDLGALQKFAIALADKNVVRVEGGNLSLVLDNDKAKICGHKDGFNYTNNFNAFLNCLDSLVKINGLGFKGFEMTVDQNGVSLGGNKLNENSCKKSDFWNQVKNYPALFGLDSNKLQIEKNNENVKINGFETDLNWNEVVGENGATIKDSWNGIFVINVKKEKVKEEVVVEEKKEGEENPVIVKTKIAYVPGKAQVGDEEVELKNLATKLQGLDMKSVAIDTLPKWSSFKKVNELQEFLTFVQALVSKGLYKKINITITGENVVKFDDVKLNITVDNIDFWACLNGFSDVFANKLNICRMHNNLNKVSLDKGGTIVIFKGDFDISKCVILKKMGQDISFFKHSKLEDQWNLFTYVDALKKN